MREHLLSNEQVRVLFIIMLSLSASMYSVAFYCKESGSGKTKDGKNPSVSKYCNLGFLFLAAAAGLGFAIIDRGL